MMRMVIAFRTGGHFAANLDPLLASITQPELAKSRRQRLAWIGETGSSLDVMKFINNNPKEFDYSVFDLQNINHEVLYYLGGDVFSKYRSSFTVSDLASTLVKCYCKNVGIEVMHIKDSEKRNWVLNQVENGVAIRMAVLYLLAGQIIPRENR